MAQVRALVKCFVDNGLREEGDVFDYDGPDNACLEPIRPAKGKKTIVSPEFPEDAE